MGHFKRNPLCYIALNFCPKRTFAKPSLSETLHRIFLPSFDLMERHSLTDVRKTNEIVKRVVGRRTLLGKLLRYVMIDLKKIMHSTNH